MDIEPISLTKSPTVAVVGMATMDYLYLLDSHVKEDSENEVRKHYVGVGGPAGRGSITAARLGGHVRVYAMCGTGLHADVLKQNMVAESLDCHFFEVDQDSQHSCCLLAADTGTRTTIWIGQPSADERLLTVLDDAFRGAAAALLDCTDHILTKTAIESCQRQGIPIVIDTGSYKPYSEDFLNGVDYIVSPAKFFRRRHPDLSLEDAMARTFADFGPKALVATQAEAGGLYMDQTGLRSYDAAEVATVDSCGAGDTFHGAFAFAIAAGADLPLTLDIAAWAAASKCAVLGNDGIPHAADLTRHLAQRAAR
ncbi:PfkB family carbohydrate kinase [Nocardia sp. NPDC049707]|uniref:PfkB family carbohydrate kinase n=1 Tax=Nocardia sp. NPDC049707 TaxID=3154735 RepID=UPI00341884DA